ncbi:TPA: hypothetical protein HA324_00075 [Candidatus Thalassarchaeaceae archaeon]|nr:plastocyanin/azurin family copper-binding protein [Euryarchaeota archaeon]DAC63358.1 MAG TPA: hypothetical protein D7I04_03180 [Candidatus Poseidoniales archaeon]DAC68118.1 MAG TPA: hypothetical protein D7I14_00070 [Candidatus Poseidoniales archaeon]HIH06238.1 hypothetical protein [Candidatus Thalassarchaeaceae archaeon]HII41554.1 hypothetical protein [Candidatus Thalassarchaeaceae archaeon]
MKFVKFYTLGLVFPLIVFSLLGTNVISEESGNATQEDEIIISVDSTNLRFSPAEVTISEGDTVRFFWDGELLAHNAVEENNLFDSGEPERNVDYSFTFEKGMNGTYEFVCEPHESANMIGRIIVTPAPVIEDNTTEEDDVKENSVPGFSALTLIGALVISSLATRGKMGRV